MLLAVGGGGWLSMTVGPQSHWFQVNESSFLPRACAGRGEGRKPCFSSHGISCVFLLLDKQSNL